MSNNNKKTIEYHLILMGMLTFFNICYYDGNVWSVKTADVLVKSIPISMITFILLRVFIWITQRPLEPDKRISLNFNRFFLPFHLLWFVLFTLLHFHDTVGLF
jgi:hypothetical protein